MMIEKLVTEFRFVIFTILLRAHRIAQQAFDAIRIGRIEADTDVTGEVDGITVDFDRLVTDPPDVIMLNLLMSEGDGFGFLAEARSRDILKDVPVVVMTSEAITAKDRERLKGVQFILRSDTLREGELVASVQQVLADRRS